MAMGSSPLALCSMGILLERLHLPVYTSVVLSYVYHLKPQLFYGMGSSGIHGAGTQWVEVGMALFETTPSDLHGGTCNFLS